MKRLLFLILLPATLLAQVAAPPQSLDNWPITNSVLSLTDPNLTNRVVGWDDTLNKFVWVANGSGGAVVSSIGMTIDGAGSAITVGEKGVISIPYACTINSVTLLADVSGSVVVDIWKDTYTNYPPVVGDSITASAKPTISSATKSTDATLTGWTTSVAAGDILKFKVDSASTITKLTLTLKVTK